MTRERIKDFREIVLPFFTNYFLKENYENLGKSDAEEFEKDFKEIVELADKALEQEPCKVGTELAHWIDNHNGTISCSHCNTWFHKDDRYSYMRYCPYCTVKMVDPQESEE